MSVEPAPRNLAVRAWDAIDERFQLSGLVGFLAHKEVPVAHSIVWYYLGGLSLFLFVVQIGTGILLLMNYQVGENTSYESMKHLVGRVPFGWLIRSIHCWSAHLMSLSVLAHLFSVLFVKAYRKPRELTWYSGFAMLGLVLGFGFSGYLLPWNELSYFATAVGTDSVKAVPVVGPWLLRVLRGGEEVSVQTLYRFFALHVCILPLVMAGLIGGHLLFIQRQGMAEPMDVGHEPLVKKRGMPFFPNFALRDLLLWVVVLNVLALLAVVLPFGPGIPGAEWELGEKANPLKPAYPGIKPEWYFLWVYQMLKEFPAHIFGMEGPQACLLLATVLMGIAFFVPLLDRNAAKGKPSPLFTDLGVAGILFLGFLTLKAWDVGVTVQKGKDPAADPVLANTIARTAAVWILGIGLAIVLLRRLKWKHAAFDFSIAVLLQAALNGFAHLSWLVSGGIALAALAAMAIARRVRGGGAAAAAALAFAVVLGPPARADEKAAAPAAPASTASSVPTGHVAEEAWPADFRKVYLATEKNVPVLDEKARARFKALPTHAQELFFGAAKAGTLSGATHLAALLALDIDDRKVELILGDNCLLCHSNPDLPDEILFRRRDKGDPLAHLDLREIVSDVHFRGGLMCAGCHGGKPTDLEMSAEIGKRWPSPEVRHKDRSWIPEFCARCHSSSEFMRSYNPSLPVDQLLKYRTSKHGQLLLGKKDSKAAQCVSCHGVHGIRPPDSTNSLVYRENIPATCGKCHADAAYMKGYTLEDGKTPLPTNQLEQYRKSIHGLALLVKHDAGAPACNGCHGNHAALPPQVSFVSQVCRNCHAANGSLFDGSPHKKAFQKHGWPECETCHGKHNIARPTDEMLRDAPEALCHACHKKFGTPKCEETARFFHTSITSLAESHEALTKDVDRLAERGFDVDELRFQSSAVNDALRKTRLGIHTFDRSDFTRNSQEASKALSGLQDDSKAVWAEYRFRRNGLILASGLISLFAVLLYLKIKQVDREPRLK
ncbi:MAG: cytochrome b N-terminal domain-containing protein [Thermoanaerobaculia bacterium]|nr:cytochrome b N-terminal domain-containing protein [Thermoanaerobaculia bacterium]